MDAGVFESAPVQSPPGSHHRPGAHHRDRNRVLSFPQNAGGTAEKESLVAFRASTELSRGRDSGRRPFLGAPSRLSSDRTGGSVISTLEEKDSYDVGGADRKSTRLNSSHQIISYAVFCLKKKT